MLKLLIGSDKLKSHCFSQVLTVGEAFGKQLLQIPGLTAEKVVPILESYPTLRQ